MKDTLALAFGLLCMTVLSPTVSSAAGVPREPHLTFDVYLDDTPIGEHRFEFGSGGNFRTVRSEAAFKVKVLFVTAYEYEHRNREVWRDGCLQAIDAWTDSNGTVTMVKGAQTDAGFVVRTDDGTSRLDSCVRTFAYWDRTLLEGARLLNSQTGEHVAVYLEPLGNGQLQVGGETVPVARYALVGKSVDITLYYAAATDQWVALDTQLDGGRSLQYRLRRDTDAASRPRQARKGAG